MRNAARRNLLRPDPSIERNLGVWACDIGQERHLGAVSSVLHLVGGYLFSWDRASLLSHVERRFADLGLVKAGLDCSSVAGGASSMMTCSVLFSWSKEGGPVMRRWILVAPVTSSQRLSFCAASIELHFG